MSQAMADECKFTRALERATAGGIRIRAVRGAARARPAARRKRGGQKKSEEAVIMWKKEQVNGAGKRKRGARAGATRPRKKQKRARGGDVEEHFIQTAEGPKDGGLVVGLRRVLRCMDREKEALQAVVICGRECPEAFNKVVEAYCASRPNTILRQMAETTPEALGSLFGIASATVIGFRTETRHEFLAALEHLK